MPHGSGKSKKLPKKPPRAKIKMNGPRATKGREVKSGAKEI